MLTLFGFTRKIGLTSKGKPQYKRYLDEMPGRVVQSIWTDISPVNSQGIFSKYFQNETTNTSIAPLESSSRVESIGVADKDATAIIRLENKKVLSGIDNSLFNEYGARDIYFAMAPTVAATDGAGLLDSAQLDIEAEVQYLNDGHDEGQFTGGSGVRVKCCSL